MQKYAILLDRLMTELVSRGWSIEELKTMRACRLGELATASLLMRADEVEMQVQLGTAVAMMSHGKAEATERIMDRIDGWRQTQRHSVAPDEQRYIDAIEEELAAEYPFYADEKRLNAVWRNYGSNSDNANGDRSQNLGRSPMLSLLGL